MADDDKKKIADDVRKMVNEGEAKNAAEKLAGELRKLREEQQKTTKAESDNLIRLNEQQMDSELEKEISDAEASFKNIVNAVQQGYESQVAAHVQLFEIFRLFATIMRGKDYFELPLGIKIPTTGVLFPSFSNKFEMTRQLGSTTVGNSNLDEDLLTKDIKMKKLQHFIEFDENGAIQANAPTLDGEEMNQKQRVLFLSAVTDFLLQNECKIDPDSSIDSKTLCFLNKEGKKLGSAEFANIREGHGKLAKSLNEYLIERGLENSEQLVKSPRPSP